MLLSILLGIICALGIFVLIMAIALLGNLFSIQNKADSISIKSLQMEPDGVEDWIERPDGSCLRALHKGSGIPVVLLHDVCVSVVSMNLMWRLLAGYGFRVITYDQRGHGYSTVGSEGISSAAMVEDLEAILDHFEVQGAILVGHSSGAFLTIRYLLQYQEKASRRVRGAVSVSGFAGNIFRGRPQNRFTRGLIQSGIMRQLLKIRLLGWGYATTFFGEDVSASRVRVWLDLIRSNPLRRFLPILPSQTKENLYDRLWEIDTPYIVTASMADRRLAPEHSLRMAEALPNAKLEWVNDAGNMMLWECPGKIVEMVRSLAHTG